jgi:hypothetical protein
MPVWSQENEKKFVLSLIQDINSQLLQDLDADPNFSRSRVRPAMHATLRTGSIEAVIVIGGSNAGQLADCCTALGLNVTKHVKSGWKINRDSVDKLIPELEKTLSQTPENVPVVIQGLDNSAYFGATDDGGMTPLSKCVPKDKGFHAVGALVVASERSISSTVTQLNRLISACGCRQVFILSVMPRFIIMPCCDHPGHMTNFLDENYLRTILRDLTSLRTSVKRMLVGGQLVDTMELICGDQYSLEKAEAAARAGWTTDPVHPSKHTVAKIGLHLIEKMGNYSPVGSGGDSGGNKRAAPAVPRSDSRAATKRRRDESSEDEKVMNRSSRSEAWKERMRGGGRSRGGDAPRFGGGRGHWGKGGYNDGSRSGSNRYGNQDGGYMEYQRDGYTGRGANRGGDRGGGGGYRGGKNRGYNRWGYPF